jgi:hypothetical protein
MVSFIKWEKQYRKYVDEEGKDIFLAWHLANRDFGIGRKEYEEALTRPVICDMLPPYDKERNSDVPS